MAEVFHYRSDKRVSLPKLKALWDSENEADAVSRAKYVAFDIMRDIGEIGSGRALDMIAVDNIAKKAQIIVNLLSPYAEDEVPEDFRQELFYSLDIRGKKRPVRGAKDLGR